MGNRGLAVIAFAAVLAKPALAQDTTAPAARRPTANPAAARDAVPVNARPPAGMCRIWLDDVPVAQQPAPTDCKSAVRNRPARGRVIFGDDYVAKPESAARVTPFSKGFAPQKQQQRIKPLPKPDTLP